MSDILLVFPPDRRPFASQLQAALREAGYGAAIRTFSEDEAQAIQLEIARAPAALFVWSRSLAYSPRLDRWLPGLRGTPGLIEVTPDGIEPEPAVDGRVVLLSGWRGQPFHLGWQKVLAALEARCGGRASPAPAAADCRPAAATAAAAGTAGGQPTRPRLKMPALAAAGALALTIAALAWPNGRPDQPSRAAAPSPEIARVNPAPSPAGAGGATESVGPAAMPAVAPAAPGAEAQPARSPALVRSAAWTERKPIRIAQAGPIKRYSKRNSRTMRLFCARSGRFTPQCRVFARSIAAQSA